MQPNILQQLYKKWQVLNFLKSQKGDITFRAYVLVYIKQMLNIINISDIAMAGLTTNVMAQMGKNKPIILKNLERICKALDCTPNDVFSFDDEYVERKID